jgi:hypothetical protein
MGASLVWLRFLCVVQRTVPPAGEPPPVAGNPVACPAVPTGVEHLPSAPDFLLFGSLSTFPEVLGLFTGFFFGHIVLPFYVVFRFCLLPGKLMVSSGKIFRGFSRFVLRR